MSGPLGTVLGGVQKNSDVIPLKSASSRLGYLYPHLIHSSFGTPKFTSQMASIGSAVFARLTAITDRQTKRQADWFYGPIAPPGPNAPSSECLPNVVPNSEFQTCPDPEFPNALHSEFMNTPNVEFLNVPLCSAPMSYLASSSWGRPLCYGHAAACCCLQRARGACGGCIALDGGVSSVLSLWR